MHLWRPLSCVPSTTLSQRPISTALKSGIKSGAAEIHKLHPGPGTWFRLHPHDVVRLHVAVYNSSFCKLFQGGKAPLSNNLDVLHIFEQCWVSIHHLEAVATLNQVLYSITNHVPKGINQPREELFFRVNTLNALADSEQVCHQLYRQAVLPLHAHLLFSRHVKGQECLRKVSCPQDVLDPVALAENFTHILPFTARSASRVRANQAGTDCDIDLK
mmetsp:Transcript_83259/g.147111  ORF Transcript_83259/g.147111 Transcript_83259/m.147111 type:complete len:216 (-) Transcript_83259:775-1422(-)